MNKSEFLRRFTLASPASYHPGALVRTQNNSKKAMRQAAVLIGFVERSNGLNIIFTKRASHLRHHPGQISFPGGKVESSDPSLEFTAVREAEEEIGIDQHSIQIVGALPPLPTISQFLVTPVVALIDANYQSQIDTNEVELLFEAPASFILNPKNLFTQQFQIKGFNHRVFAVPYNHHFIWGVTGQIIEALQQQIQYGTRL